MVIPAIAARHALCRVTRQLRGQIPYARFLIDKQMQYRKDRPGDLEGNHHQCTLKALGERVLETSERLGQATSLEPTASPGPP